MSPDSGHPLLPTIPYDRDDAMLEAVLRDGRAQLRLQRWPEPTVVIGRGGHQDRELFTAAINRDRIPLLKRAGGGCSVVLDPGNLTVAVGLPLPGIGGITRAFTAISGWLCAGLDCCGIPGIRQEGVSDLVLEDRKIGGSCVYRTRGLLYYSTTLLVDPDISLVGQYLRHPPREPAYRRSRPHDQFMGALYPRYWTDTPEALILALENALTPGLDDLVDACR